MFQFLLSSLFYHISRCQQGKLSMSSLFDPDKLTAFAYLASIKDTDVF